MSIYNKLLEILILLDIHIMISSPFSYYIKSQNCKMGNKKKCMKLMLPTVEFIYGIIGKFIAQITFIHSIFIKIVPIVSRQKHKLKNRSCYECISSRFQSLFLFHSTLLWVFLFVWKVIFYLSFYEIGFLLKIKYFLLLYNQNILEFQIILLAIAFLKQHCSIVCFEYFR